jgi:integrase
MAALAKTPSGTWKATIRRVGWPTAVKTFRTKRDAEDWSRRTEDEMVRGVFIQRGPSERTTVADALDRYEREIVPTKKASTQRREAARLRLVKQRFGQYSLAAITPDLVAKFRDARLAEGKANNTVRLELALLGHLFTIAIKEWHIGLVYNPVTNIRKPSPGEGRDRRLVDGEQQRLLTAVELHANPMLGWIVRLAIETGMRQSEILGLRRSQVELGRRIVRLTDTKNDASRTVPLSIAATEVLRTAMDHPIRSIGTDLLFFGEAGKDGKRRAYQFAKVWNAIKKKEGLR